MAKCLEVCLSKNLEGVDVFRSPEYTLQANLFTKGTLYVHSVATVIDCKGQGQFGKRQTNEKERLSTIFERVSASNDSVSR